MWQTYLNYHQRMGILPLKKRVNRNKCSFATKLRMFVVFTIDEILCYRWAPLAGSRTLCHPALQICTVSTEIKAGNEQFDHEAFFRIFCWRQINKMRISKIRAVSSCHQKLQKSQRVGRYLGIVELFIRFFSNHLPASISNWYNFKYYLLKF